MTGTVFVDSFTTGLDELPMTLQRSGRETLRAIRDRGGFSVFEATANDVIAATVDWILDRGHARRIESRFPWCAVELTDRASAEWLIYRQI